jgi:CHAT domain-containing protein
LQKSDSPQHIHWCPTGPFTFLPIHAAGLYGVEKTESVSDYIVSSYTPTIGALLNATPHVPESCKMLVVIQPDQPQVPGYTALEYTAHELTKIEDHVPTDWLVRLGIPEAPASVETVLSHLPTVSIAHFACHGEQNALNPLDSALILHDGRLKVSQIIQQPLPNASLAVLSACQTAMGDAKLPDEVIHLGATLLFAGFRGVIATMW